MCENSPPDWQPNTSIEGGKRKSDVAVAVAAASSSSSPLDGDAGAVGNWTGPLLLLLRFDLVWAFLAHAGMAVCVLWMMLF